MIDRRDRTAPARWRLARPSVPDGYAGCLASEGKPFELVQTGKLSPEEYKKFVGDLTNFLVYASEPGREHRKAVGWKVLAFLSVFLVLAYMLKKEYWKDVH